MKEKLHRKQLTIEDLAACRFLEDFGQMKVIGSGSFSGSGVASPKKWGRGPNHVSLLVSSESYNIYIHGDPPICKKKNFSTDSR